MTISVKLKTSPRPQADKDYPRSYGEFLAWFPDDEACLDYLDWLRWSNGFSCPRCEGETAWRLSDGRWWCAECRRRISVTAGTIYHRTQTPLTLWFAAAWYMTSSKNGVAAKTLHRLLSFGSYQTVWAMLHRYRNAMVRPGRDRLCGDVEVNETMIGGVKPGKRGRGAQGKVLVAVAVEQTPPKGFGRCRLKVIPNAQSPTLRSFLLDQVEPGSTLITDGLSSYHGAAGSDYVHNPTPVKGSGMKAHELLPGVHQGASLVKRWLLGNPPRLGGRRPLAGVSPRVYVPVQPAPLTGKGDAFLPAAPTSGRDCSRVLQGTCSQPQAERGKQTHTAEGQAHSSAVAASGGPASPMALISTALVWIPLLVYPPFVPGPAVR